MFDAAGPSDDLWRTGYRLNEDMRPTFITRQMACTILRAGKSINFLRYTGTLLLPFISEGLDTHLSFQLVCIEKWRVNAL